MRIVFRLFNDRTGEEIASYASPYGPLRTYKDLLKPKFQLKFLKGITALKEGKAIKSVRFAPHASIACAAANRTCRIVIDESEAAPKNTLSWDQFVMRMGLPDSLLIPVQK
jgi:hypothetical protein